MTRCIIILFASADAQSPALEHFRNRFHATYAASLSIAMLARHVPSSLPFILFGTMVFLG
jgi:hypothetical protein